MYKANVRITLRPSILDPQGKATRQALNSLSYASIDRVRMGKFVEMWIEEADESEARRVAVAACEKLLANPVMEDFEIELEAVASEPA
jgi:phosphoribosylformylglycinamidine synthase